MRELNAFIKKEWHEAVASYRVAILVILFILFGIVNVFTAKYTPEIISYVVSEEFAKAMPTPSLIDAWLQFYKNIGQMGIIVAVILFSGTLTNEYNHGTLTLLVTKGLTRWKILVAKFFMNTAVFTIAYLLGILVTFVYGKIYFKSIELPHIELGLIILWVFMLFLLLLVNLGSVLLKSNYLVLLFVGSINVVLMVLNFIPDIKKYNPITLFTCGTPLLQGSLEVTDVLPAIYVVIGIGILIKFLTIILFNKKSL